MTRRLTAALVVTWGLAGAASAQPALPPQIRPSRDVMVTYQMDGQALSLVPGGVQGPVTLSWDAAGQRLRAEMAGRSQVALIDLREHSGQVIDTALRLVLPVRVRPQDLQPLTLEGAHLVPLKRETVAGLTCMGYSFESQQGPGSVCLTADGVPLRGQGTVSGKPGSFTATVVQYGPIPADRFSVPSGYMSLSGGGGQGSLAGLAQKYGGSSGLNLNSLLGRSK